MERNILRSLEISGNVWRISGTKVSRGWRLRRLRGISVPGGMMTQTRRYATSGPPEGWRDRIKPWMQSIDQRFVATVKRFHDVTGYSEIERLKQQIIDTEAQVARERASVRAKRDGFNEAVARRTMSQHEMNELLLRKQAWTPQDLERFTELYKDDHTRAQDADVAKAAYESSESHLEELQLQLGRLIGHRYREEQLWSDKIRQTSTWGTWVLMGVNLVLFIVVQLGIEPWKRRKLVSSFESKVAELLTPTMTPMVSQISSQVARDAVNQTQMQTKVMGDSEDGTGLEPEERTWSNLWRRLQQPVIELRPIETMAALIVPFASLIASAVIIAGR